MKKSAETHLALLVTEDTAVETAVRQQAQQSAHEVKCVRDCRAAMSDVIEGCGNEAVAIVDLETMPSARRLVETASGSLPVIAITAKETAWLSSMLRRRRVAATLVKPFTARQLSDALSRVRALRGHEGRAWW